MSAGQIVDPRRRLGTGVVRGVASPESANNACQGGALIPTLLFGVPGSGSMAVFLGGMVLLGIQPGVTMVETKLDLTYTIIWSLALANVVGAGLCVLLARPVARLTQVPFVYLAPFMVMIAMFAAFQASRSMADLVALMVMGMVGMYMRRFGWPRPALLIGFVLAPGAENYLYQAVQFYDWDWITRPGVIIIALITIISVWLGLRFGTEISSEGDSDTADQKTRGRQIAFAGLLFLVAAYCILEALQLSFLGMIFPLTIGILALVASLAVILRLRAGRVAEIHDDDASATLAGESSGRETYLAVFSGLVALIWLIGFIPAMVIFFPTFLIVAGKARPVPTLLMTAGAVGFISLITWAMALRLPEGLIGQALF